MAQIIRMSKRAAHVFIMNVARADQTKNPAELKRYRDLQRRFREAGCQNYFDSMRKLESQAADARLDNPADSPELSEALRVINKGMRDLQRNAGVEPAKDEHNDGILLEKFEFNFLEGKLKDIKGVPSDGDGGDIWEEIYNAFQEAEEVNIKALPKEKTLAAAEA